MNEPPRRHHPHSSRKRSRSPRDHNRDHNVTRQRSRSPHRRHHHPPNEHGHRHHHHHHHRSKHPSPPIRIPIPVSLPFHARPLHKRDLATHRALFASYLDLQKGLDIDTLSADEARGRWKSFVGKWNRGGLAEGWYDPETKRKVDGRAGSGGGGEEGEEEGEGKARDAGLEELDGNTPVVVESGLPGVKDAEAPVREENKHDNADEDDEDEDEDEDEYGPSLPTSEAKLVGPSVPSTQDLQHRRELLEEDREAHRARIREDRRQDRKAQKERLEELVPRAEPGTRERQLEKKRERASANRAFRDAKDGGEGGGGMEDIGDRELMGGGDGEGGEDGYKAQIRARERQKNQREIRKEEVLRARAAEREGRVAEHRRKEERTMEMLRELAKQRFGS
ncbi:hypothetical protein KC332_g11976 [Hortaea werneckii]|uniref:Uncharacterized protein n=1 Tax=Hortaea werneckii TaxID=91943 RepID=A0A3M7I9A7_HORWE|nr:hypothetical protein KC350_g12307 [Hortaea werneckii]KAI6986045.1 hypothetical protein KC329_g6617 [Hortaea werneckii]KAI7275489.1 hypothetical protein KC335_g1535 [Hortaea werneckii]KAI7395987.1 hypothetical protein KC332_g11976 [Hortaea werneckii]KAI7431368.1 hypothetical protein KC336_g4600 [Hortaea werneckii]